MRFRDPVERLLSTLRLFEMYRDEARRCREAGACLAGCVLLASAMEAALLAMVQCFPTDIEQLVNGCNRKELSRPPSEWGLSQLLYVARNLGWLPSAARLEDRFDPDKAAIGDYVEIVRAMRNLVHPCIYLRECPDRTISARHLDLSFRVLDAACSHLAAELERARSRS